MTCVAAGLKIDGTRFGHMSFEQIQHTGVERTPNVFLVLTTQAIGVRKLRMRLEINIPWFSASPQDFPKPPCNGIHPSVIEILGTKKKTGRPT
ncbi:MAG TPA: hypothetical protein EYQ63_03435 [Fuerstia sp.]|nr:hypothetical protein [Fuerstiella sp.]